MKFDITKLKEYDAEDIINKEEEELNLIYEDLITMNELQEEIAKLVGEQGIEIKTTENVVEQVNKNVDISKEYIEDTFDEKNNSQLKSMIIGSTIGIVTMGPVGFVVGLGYGSIITAIGGGIVGGIIGKKM